MSDACFETTGCRTAKVLFIPSWYPSLDHPTAGVFILQQVVALHDCADVAVLYVREARTGLRPHVEVEDGVTVVRAQIKMPPTTTSLPGRLRAVMTNLYNTCLAYPRVGVSAFDVIRAQWGEPDVIHVQALWPAGLIASAIKRRYGIPYVVTEHSEEYLAASERRLVRTPGMLPLVLRPLAGRASRAIAVSRYLANRLIELGLARNPAVIPNVVPVSEPTPLHAEPPHLIAHVSVMGPAKNIEGLLDAAHQLQGRRSDFAVRLVGDGELRESLERRAGELGLEGVVEFTGSRSSDEVRSILAGSAFSVVSSTHETFSVTAAEALMCGRPVLSTRCGGPEEFITPEVGHLVDAGSVDALVDGLDWMLDHFTDFDPKTLHEYARSRFAPDVVAAQIQQVYREVLRG
jgi:glycosyltransferase involved in cell wall biosynthesis